MGAFFGFLLVICAAGGVFVASIMSRDPESGRIFFDPSWIGSWAFCFSIFFLGYTAITFGLFVVAIRRYWTDRADWRPFTLASYLMLPVFPVGTIYSIYALSMVAAEKKTAEVGDSDAEPCL